LPKNCLQNESSKFYGIESVA